MLLDDMRAKSREVLVLAIRGLREYYDHVNSFVTLMTRSRRTFDAFDCRKCVCLTVLTSVYLPYVWHLGTKLPMHTTILLVFIFIGGIPRVY